MEGSLDAGWGRWGLAGAGGRGGSHGGSRRRRAGASSHAPTAHTWHPHPPPRQVYPGASHARFEHSLGVAHLAGTWAKHLLAAHRPGEALLREDRRSVRALELAGLCHDLGGWAAAGAGGVLRGEARRRACLWCVSAGGDL
jgi:hypothetical protein